MRPELPSVQRSTFLHYSISLGSSWTKRWTPLDNMKITCNHSYNCSPNGQSDINPTESTASFIVSDQGRCWRCHTGKVGANSSHCISWCAGEAHHLVAGVSVALAAQTVSRAQRAVAIYVVVCISSVAARTVNSHRKWSHCCSKASISACGTASHAEHAHTDSLREWTSKG